MTTQQGQPQEPNKVALTEESPEEANRKAQQPKPPTQPTREMGIPNNLLSPVEQPRPQDSLPQPSAEEVQGGINLAAAVGVLIPGQPDGIIHPYQAENVALWQMIPSAKPAPASESGGTDMSTGGGAAGTATAGGTTGSGGVTTTTAPTT